MASGATPPVWINLEYLSAEPWVDTVHGLASPQPRLPLERYFWFPGLHGAHRRTDSGSGLLESRRCTPRQSGVCAAARPLRISSLFCYPNRALPALFDAWSEGDEPIRCVDTRRRCDRRARPVAARRRSARRPVRRARPAGARRDPVRRHRTHSTGCSGARDVNFVRGEDSFVRAQWAARAFVWQPYPQDRECASAEDGGVLDPLCSRSSARASGRADRILARVQRRRRRLRSGGVAGVSRRRRTVGGAWTAAGQARWRPCRNLAAGLVAFARVGYNFGFPRYRYARLPSGAGRIQEIRHENRPGSSRRQRDHDRQQPDGGAEGRIQQIRPQRVGRQDEAAQPALRRRHGNRSIAPTRSST